MNHTDGDNALYWAAQARNWLEANSTVEVGEVVAIAGDAVVELADEWSDHHAEGAREELLGQGFPPTRVEDRHDGGLRLRIDANDDRFPVPFEAPN